VYRDTPSNYQKITDAARKQADFAYSLGFVVGKEGKLADVQWDGVAYGAGLVPGDQLVAVNGDAYSDDGLKAAVKAAKGTTSPIELIVKVGDRYR
ncbi:peptidase M61, partial [Pseudomonas sp. GW456-12-1-14-TSB1]|uniref:PDZ domain-containing protein n=1 Tax=Pseudomonas sp. GW456-12-1-14-TSB1 TaxID=2751349 RepID=UPI000CB6E636